MELYITSHALNRVKERIPDMLDGTIETFIRKAWKGNNIGIAARKKYERKLSTKNLVYKEYGGYIFCFRTYKHSATGSMYANLMTVYRR